jgi:hypothetical protein
MKKSCFLLLPLLLSLCGCNGVKTVTLSGEDVTENVTAGQTIFSVHFESFSLQDSSYSVEILPVSAEHPFGYSFTHSSNLEEAAGFSSEQDSGAYIFKTKDNCQLKGGTFQLKVYAALNYLTINGSLPCALSGVGSVLDIKVDGAATITTPEPINLTMLFCKIKGAATINLSGNSEGASYQVEGASDIKAASFITENTTIDLEGAGSAEVYAKNSFQGSVEGAGSIVYYGNPTSVFKSVEGVGSITSA